MDESMKQAMQCKPKKPINVYFKFRAKFLEEHRNEEDRSARCKEAWENLDVGTKDRMEMQYKQELMAYQEEMQVWKLKYDIDKSNLTSQRIMDSSLPYANNYMMKEVCEDEAPLREEQHYEEEYPIAQLQRSRNHSILDLKLEFAKLKQTIKVLDKKRQLSFERVRASEPKNVKESQQLLTRQQSKQPIDPEKRIKELEYALQESKIVNEQLQETIKNNSRIYQQEIRSLRETLRNEQSLRSQLLSQIQSHVNESGQSKNEFLLELLRAKQKELNAKSKEYSKVRQSSNQELTQIKEQFHILREKIKQANLVSHHLKSFEEIKANQKQTEERDSEQVKTIEQTQSVSLLANSTSIDSHDQPSLQISQQNLQ